jgi:hypothetical protein
LREQALERGRARLEGRDPASVSTDIQSTVERMTEKVADASAILSDLSETKDAIMRARATGDTAEVERLKAEFMRRSRERES